MAFSPVDENLLLRGLDGGIIELWNVADDKCVKTFMGHKKSIRALAFSRDGCRFLSSSDDKTVRLWSICEENALRVFEGHSEYVYGCHFFQNEEYVISWDNSIKLWHIDSGKCVETEETGEFLICSSLSPNEQELSLGASRGHLLLYSTPPSPCTSLDSSLQLSFLFHDKATKEEKAPHSRSKRK